MKILTNVNFSTFNKLISQKEHDFLQFLIVEKLYKYHIRFLIFCWQNLALEDGPRIFFENAGSGIA
jgi:hypothetical protein